MKNKSKGIPPHQGYTAVIIGGMTFASPNACAHRMLGIAKLLSEVGQKVLMVGVAQNECSGLFYSFDYVANKKPMSLLQWMAFSFSAARYKRILKRIPGTLVVVINASCPSVPAEKLIRFCKRKGHKCVLDIDEWFAKSRDRFPRNLIKDFDTAIRMKHICRRNNNYIVSSKLLYEHCGGGRKNVMIFPALVTEKGDYKPNSDTKDGISLLFAGKLEKQNTKEDLGPVFKAVEQINAEDGIPFYLDIVGAKGANKPGVRFYGELPYDECISHLLSADFTLIPRQSTRKNNAGFPTKLSESFLYGVPVISTNTSDIADYVVNGKNGYLLESNSSESFFHIFRTIREELAQNPLFIDEMKKNVVLMNRLQIKTFRESFKVFYESL